MFIGIDIGGTKCAVSLGEKGGEIKEKIRFETRGFRETMNHILEAVETIGKASAIGISCGGPLNSETGTILSPPNLPGWDNVPITAMLEERFHIPAALQNDANACALAEWRYGAGKGLKNMIFLTFGTGMGAGLILNGKLYDGTCGMAGEVGHIRLEENGPVGFCKAGSFEGFCSGGGIAQIGRQKALEKLQAGETTAFCKSHEELGQITVKKIADCAKEGDALSKEVYAVCGEKLGRGIALLIDLLNPEAVVIGSIYGRAKELLEPYMRKQIEKEAIAVSAKVCNILPAGLGEKIGDYAALAVAESLAEERGLL